MKSDQDHGVTGLSMASPSTRMASTFSLKNASNPVIFRHSSIGSG
jgi:hypothetical protein